MNFGESDSDSDKEFYICKRTAVDVLRAPLELPRPTRRPPTVKHPVLSAPSKSTRYSTSSDFSPVFWKVLRDMKLEERLGKVTITELAPSPRSEDGVPSDDSSSDGDLASGETSSDENELVDELEEIEDGADEEDRCESPLKRAYSVDERPKTKMDGDTSDSDSD